MFDDRDAFREGSRGGADSGTLDLSRTIDLLHHARAGHERAWRLLHERYYGLLRGIVASDALPWLLRREEIDDLAMQALEEVLHGLHRFVYRGHDEFIGWLRRVARTTVLKRAEHYGRKKRPGDLQRLVSESSDDAGVRESQLAGAWSTPSSVNMRRESFDRLMEQVRRLRPAEQLLIRLFLEHSGDMPAVARALLLPDATVRMRWLRLRRKLEQWSEEEGA